MTITKYQSQVMSLGEFTQEFIDGGILVFFGPDAPDELAEFAIMHTHDDLATDVQAGDQLMIGEQTWTILCVGDIANQNMRMLGHFVIKLNDASEPELPGDISVSSGAPPTITPGMTIRFVAGATS